jgi:hypothetical protein
VNKLDIPADSALDDIDKSGAVSDVGEEVEDLRISIIGTENCMARNLQQGRVLEAGDRPRCAEEIDGLR